MDIYSWVALLTLITTVLVVWKVRKRKEYKYSLLDTSGVILNLVLIVMIYPPLSVASGLLGSEGFVGAPDSNFWGNTAIAMGRLTPAFCVAGIGASVVLRRKERPGPSFWVQFTGAAWFGITMLLAKIGGGF